MDIHYSWPGIKFKEAFIVITCSVTDFAGAYGYFEVTHDITKFCRAKLFDTIGKKTPMFIRFSTVGEFG